jgi:Ca2+-binding RTX toxin-like protein
LGLFGDRSFAEFALLLRAANAAFGKPAPAGWTQVEMADLGIDQNGDTFTSRNGRGKAIVLENGGQLVVAFRGTDKWNDIKDYDSISASKSYSRQFDKLLEKVAKYQDAHDLETTFTGISLGGAVVNIVADKAPHQWDGAFKNASFVGIASPYLSNNIGRDIFNFGMRNDLIYGLVPGSWNPRSKSMAVENTYIYEKHHFLTDHLDDTIRAHHVGHLNQAIASLYGLTVEGGAALVDVLRPDSYLLFDNIRSALEARELRHPDSQILTIVGQGRDDRINGAAHKAAGGDRERIYGLGGDDVIAGRGGHDELHGGNGDDRLDGGGKRDVLYGDGGNDKLYLANDRDRAEGGDGRDRFFIDTVPRNGSGPSTVFLDDFTPDEDWIVLAGFDGNSEKKGFQPLKHVEYVVYDASDGLSDLELGYVHKARPGWVTIYEDENGDTLLIINRDHDRGREFVIKFDGALGDFSGDLLL